METSGEQRPNPVVESGTATTPATYDEGIVSLSGIPVSDVNGSPAGGHDALLAPGNTWSSVKSNGSANLTRTVFNFLGQPYLTQQSAPNPGNAFPQPMADAVTTFDGDGRPTKFVGYDGTASYTTYDPTTGQPASTFVDVKGNGVFTPGKDILSRSTFTPATTLQTAAAGSTSTYLSNKGVQTSVSTTTLSSGITQSSNTNGLTTTSVTTVPSGGAWTTTTTNPDGTKVVDTYTDGLLTREDVLPTSGSTPTTWTSYVYDGMRQLITSTDFTGDTHYTYFEDGTEATVQTPGHNAVTVHTIDQTNNAATQTTRSDNGTINTPQNSLGQASSVNGAGVLPTTFNYDTGGTGQLTSLTTYKSNALGGSGAATTTWHYDPSTGLLDKKTFADGTSDTYGYNAKRQLTSISEPGITGSNFKYDAAGRLVSSSLTDSTTGTVSSSTQYDDMGRPIISSGSDNGKSYTNTVSYNANGQLDQALFDIASSRLTYDYFTGSETGSSPQALKDTILYTPGEQAPVQTDYTYDPSTKRLQTIVVNGITFTIDYQANSNQIYHIIATPPGGATNVTVRYTQDSTDPARISQQVVSANGSALTETVSGYNQQDQITGQTITRKNSDGSNPTDTYGYGYNSGNADALTSVTDTVGTNSTTTQYVYDGVGNLTSTQVDSNTATNYGTINSINQYSSLSYNLRGDVTADSTAHYVYDAQDRMIEVIPNDTSQHEVKLGYDSLGRMLWEDVYTYSSSAWTYAYSRHFVWDGSNLNAVEDGNNNLLVDYTWEPNGQLLAETDYTASGGPKTDEAISDLSGNMLMLVDPKTDTVDGDFHYTVSGQLLSANGSEAANCFVRGKGELNLPEIRGIGFSIHPSGDGSDRALNYAYSRFMQHDVAGELAGGVNLYDYVGNDPINKIDPTGNDWRDVLSYVSPLGIPRLINQLGMKMGQDEVDAYQQLGWTKMAKVGQISIGVGQAADSIMDGVEAVNIFKLPKRLRDQEIARQNYEALSKQINPAQAFIITAAKSTPILSSVANGYEIYDGRDLSSGIGFGHQLSLTEMGQRGGSIGFDLATVTIGGIGVVKGMESGPVITVAGETAVTTNAVVAPSSQGIGVAIYEVDTYGNLRIRSLRGDMLDLDHQPSNASNIARAEAELGRRLTPTELAVIRDQGTAVAVPQQWHRSFSPSYGGRNNFAQIQFDALNPQSAAFRDSQAMIDGANADRAAAEAAATQIRQRAGGL